MQRRFFRAATGLAASAVLTLAAGRTLQAQAVSVGAGGYRTTRPEACKALPATIHRTADLTGPIRTGQWWSSLIWKPFSEPMFAHPLALRCTEGGLAVSYPGGRITANKVGIFGQGIGPNGDLEIGHSAVRTFPRADCGGYSDWFVTAVFAAEEGTLRTSFGHGSPFVFGEITGGRPRITFANTPQIWAGGAGDATLGVTVNGHHYGLFGPTGSTWAGLGSNTLTNHAQGRGYFTVAILPDRQRATLDQFARHAHNHVTGTRLEFSLEGGVLRADYRFTTAAREGGDTGTLFALYPHQWKYTTTPLTAMTYGSVRGTMKLAEGSGFTTSVPVQGVLPLLPPQGVGDRDRLLGYLQSEAARPKPGFGDTYREGKHLGKLASLSGVAEAADAPELQAAFVAELKRRLEAWFTASPGKEESLFYHDSNWGTLVGSRPSFGSDRPLNDHHFHYGYFIRAAAEVARVDPAWAAAWGPMVELLIRDIASPDRQDAMFPHLRSFDAYAGHSWASGDAGFADGNNQESSSEAMNAWYGLILWGEFTGNRVLRDFGVGLFNTERTAVEEYWFDVAGTNFPSGYPNEAAGLVWGGKTVFETWFSADIDAIHGINWLPFTPASLYLGRHPDYVRRSHDRVVSVRAGGADYNNGWGDLVCLFNALEDPGTSAGYLDRQPDCKVEAGNTRAFMYHWIHTLQNLGRNDATVTADHPLAVAFAKDQEQTYAAYNGGPEPLTVAFSDGVRLLAKPRALTIQRSVNHAF